MKEKHEEADEVDLDKVYDVDSYEYELVMNKLWGVDFHMPENYEKCLNCSGIAVTYPATLESIHYMETDTILTEINPKYTECVEPQMDPDADPAHGCGWRVEVER